MTLRGGGQEVTFAGEGEPNTNTILSHLADAVGIYDGLWTEGRRISRPSRDLGPRVTAVWLFMGSADDIPIEQHLYPLAEGGPVGHIPGGQALWDDVVADAWFPLADDVVDQLAVVGFEVTAMQPAPSVEVVAPPPPPPSPVPRQEPSTGLEPGWAFLAVAGLGIGLWGIMGRRRDRKVA